MKFKTLAARFALLACCIATGVGCQSAVVERPVTAVAGGNDADQQVDFWHRLAETPITSYDDAFHALLLFTDGQDPAADYDGRVKVLKERKLLASGFNRPGNEAVDRGTLAVAISRGIQLRGGMLYSLLPPNGRYATRELEFQGVFPPSSPNQTFSGSEFLAVMSRAEEYQKSQSGGSTGGAGYRPPEMQLKEPKPAAPATQPAAQ
jgi:hypothetical protein